MVWCDGEAVVAALGVDEKLREFSLRIQSVAGHHSASQIHGFDEVDRLSDLVLFFLDQNLLDTQLVVGVVHVEYITTAQRVFLA